MVTWKKYKLLRHLPHQNIICYRSWLSSGSFLLCLRAHKINIRALLPQRRSCHHRCTVHACILSIFPLLNLAVAKSSKTPDYLHERRAEENFCIVLVFRIRCCIMEHKTRPPDALCAVSLSSRLSWARLLYMLWVQTMLRVSSLHVFNTS